MSEIVSSESTSCVNEKPALSSRQNLLNNDVKFPPFPDPTEEEFEEDIGDEERTYYRNKFSDLDTVKTMRLHCSACDRHLGSSTRNESRMRAHPMLRTLVCHTCHTFYNSGEFEKGDDGSELYCRWCGQGGQVYCCSDCPHVFCAKCIKRNLGLQKIKEIENTDDWKCFKCNNKCLWDLRAVCWALLRYCDMKNKITYKTEDPVLKEAYQNDCSVDYAECCKYKSNRRKEKTEPTKKKEDTKKATATAISKIPSSIQVKKFACINLDEAKEKKPQKRPASQNDKVVFIKNPISIAPPPLNPLGLPPLKKPRIPVINPVRFAQQPERKPMNTYARIRPKLPTMPIPIIPTQFNGFNMNNNSFHNFGSMQVPNNDTLNLSLDSLTQGLDMVAVAAMASGTQDDDVVCTPDLPLEPLCEVMEDNTDDDVQCITPGPVAAPKVQTQPLLTRIENSLPDLSPDNIIQMTDNDVTVNAVTGGLKFRVDPQTLSSNKMYRLPDGRIFAIKANPNMPGGYSATIVAVTDTGVAKSAPKGATYAAKLSAVSSCQTSTPAKSNRSSSIGHGSNSKRNTSKSPKVTKGTDTSARECDLQVPVEWYRYNLVDAVDAVEYSLHRLYKLKKEATTRYLRTRSVEEMKNLHRTLDRLLNTSATRFNEIKENLNKELKQYIVKKTGGNVSDDDDDVEILPDLDDNDDPIFIDENSVESNSNDLTCNDSQEVDLTGVGSSDHNDSAEVLPENVTKNNKQDIDDNTNTENIKIPSDDISNNTNDDLKESSERQENHQDDEKVDKNDSNESSEQLPEKVNKESKIGEHDNPSSENKDGNIPENVKNGMEEETDEEKTLDTNEEKTLNGKTKQEKIDDDKKYEESKDDDKESKDEDKESKDEDKESKDDEKKILSEDISSQDNDGKLEDSEMSEEMIETLLKDDNADEGESTLNNKSMEEVEGI